MNGREVHNRVSIALKRWLALGLDDVSSATELHNAQWLTETNAENKSEYIIFNILNYMIFEDIN